MKFGYYQSSMVSLAVSSGAPRCIVGASRGVQLANGYHRVLLSGVEFAIHHRLMELSPSARRKREYMPCSCSSVPIESSHSFHQSRLRKSSATFPKNPVQLQIRCAHYLLFGSIFDIHFMLMVHWCCASVIKMLELST